MKKIYIVQWFNVDNEDYTEVVEAYTTETAALSAAQKYQATHGGQLTYFVDTIELRK